MIIKMVNMKKIIISSLFVFVCNISALNALTPFEKEFLSYSVFAGAKADNASNASVKARKEAKQQAITQLLSKVVLKEDLPKIEQFLNNPALKNLVSRMRITNETVSRTSYSANFDFEINPERMVEFLHEAGLKFVYLGKQVDLLVLPFYVDEVEGKTMLWESANPWKQSIYSKYNTLQTAGRSTGSANDVAYGKYNTLQIDVKSLEGSGITVKNINLEDKDSLRDMAEKAHNFNSTAWGSFVAKLVRKESVYSLTIISLNDGKKVFYKDYKISDLTPELLQGKNHINFIAQQAYEEFNAHFLEETYKLITSEAKESFFVVYFNNLSKLVRLTNNLNEIISIESVVVEKFYSNKAVLKVKHKDTLDSINQDLRSLGFYVEHVQRSLVGNVATVEECVNSMC